jgi:hypothetical protein
MKRFNTFTLTIASLVFAFTVMSGGVAGAVPVITNGLVAAYEFNGNANDTSGSGNHGVVNGATLTTDRFGNVGSAYAFDGTNDYISIADNPALDLPNLGTISVWFQSSAALPRGMRLVTKYRSDTSNEDGYNLLVESTLGVTGWIKDDQGNGSHSTPRERYPVGVGEWNHYAFVITDTRSVEHFLNGVRVSDASSGQPVNPSSGNALSVLIGADRFNSGAITDYFPGDIDDVYFYDRALSPSEIQTLYSVIPEPSTALLLGLGISALAVRKEKR